MAKKAFVIIEKAHLMEIIINEEQSLMNYAFDSMCVRVCEYSVFIQQFSY